MDKVAISGIDIIPPIAAPELKIPCASALSFVGNHSAFPFVAPGQLPASAIPKIDRNIPKLKTPAAKACKAVATDQTPIDNTKPNLVPIQSNILPNMA